MKSHADILEEYVAFFKEQSAKHKSLESYVRRGAVASLSSLEGRIQGFVASFETKEAPIRQALIELYKKNQKLQSIETKNKIAEDITVFEQKLKGILPDFQKRMKDLYQDLLDSPHSVDSNILADSTRLNFDVLKEEIEGLVAPPTESQLREKLMAALGKIVERF